MTELCSPTEISPLLSADDSKHFHKAVVACESMNKPVYPSVHPGSGGGGCLGLEVGAAWVPPCCLLPVALLPCLGATSLLHLPSRVLQMFKGPDKDIEFIYTAPSSAVCGVSLDVGGKKEYLIAGVWEFTLPH